jgi:DNA-binding protein H-NS
VGRKKAKASGGDELLLTPRTRGALAREATSKAKREALELEMKAAAAREAAEAAAREELEATREEFTAARDERALELMALEDVPLETPLRRYSYHLV